MNIFFSEYEYFYNMKGCDRYNHALLKLLMANQFKELAILVRVINVVTFMLPAINSILVLLQYSRSLTFYLVVYLFRYAHTFNVTCKHSSIS